MLPRRADSTRPIPHERRGRRSASGTLPAVRGGALQGTSVLVVVGDAGARDALAMHLSNEGAFAIGVEGRESALATLAGIQVDAITGELDPELLAALDARPEWAQVPRVIASRDPQAEWLARASGSEVVPAPGDHDRLARAVQGAIARRR